MGSMIIKRKILAMALFLSLTVPCIEVNADKISDEHDRLIDELPYRNPGLYAGATDALNRILIAEKNRHWIEKRIGIYETALRSGHPEINEEIYRVRYDRKLDKRQKVKRVARIFEENIDEISIAYRYGSGVFGWTTILDGSVKSGEYYHDGMQMDCSGFVQYVYYIATGMKVGQCTDNMCHHCRESARIPGTVAFHYDSLHGSIGGSNHCAIYLGSDSYIECSSGYGGVRIKENNEFYQEFYTFFADLKKDPVYYGDY